MQLLFPELIFHIGCLGGEAARAESPPGKQEGQVVAGCVTELLRERFTCPLLPSLKTRKERALLTVVCQYYVTFFLTMCFHFVDSSDHDDRPLKEASCAQVETLRI